MLPQTWEASITEVAEGFSTCPPFIPGEGTFQQVEPHCTAGCRRYNAQDVETASGSCGQVPQVTFRDGQDVLLLVACNRSRWRCEADICSSLDFDEAQDLAIPSDEVNLAAVVRRAKICGHDAIAELLKMETGLSLSPVSKVKMARLTVRVRCHLLNATDQKSSNPHAG